MQIAEQGMQKVEVKEKVGPASQPTSTTPMKSPSDDRKPARSRQSLSFVFNGRWRAVQGVKQSVLPGIRETVQAEYALRLKEAGPIGRLWIRFVIRREVKRRFNEEIAKHAPPDAMYLNQ